MRENDRLKYELKRGTNENFELYNKLSNQLSAINRDLKRPKADLQKIHNGLRNVLSDLIVEKFNKDSIGTGIDTKKSLESLPRTNETKAHNVDRSDSKKSRKKPKSPQRSYSILNKNI